MSKNHSPKPWGKSVSIDLFNCNHAKVSQSEFIKEYIRKIIPLIDMQAHGPTYIERFGSGELEGWSAMQFIETSSITIHADEVENRVFIDIFSCKPFDDHLAVGFSNLFFQSKSHKVTVLDR